MRRCGGVSFTCVIIHFIEQSKQGRTVILVLLLMHSVQPLWPCGCSVNLKWFEGIRLSGLFHRASHLMHSRPWSEMCTEDRGNPRHCPGATQ